MRPGEQLGPYVLRREIGERGIAAVFIAEHRPTRTDVVLKVLRAEFVSQPATVALFLGEPRALRAVEHENTLEITDVVEDAPQPYFATELLRGTTLAELLKRGPLPLPRALHIAGQVATVLAHAHDADVVHRNLKPANVFLVVKDGTHDFVKLLELGATRMQSEGEKPVPGTVIGTPAYMAPEQLRQVAGDHRVDLYSFGILLFELVVGRKPFIGDINAVVRQQILDRAPRARALAPAAPAVLDELIAQCLAKDPDERPPSMHEVSLTLAALGDTLAPVDAVDEAGAFIAVPKNTSGYTAVAADATVAPPPVVLAEEDEPSFKSITGERPAVGDATADGFAGDLASDLATTSEGPAENDDVTAPGTSNPPVVPVLPVVAPAPPTPPPERPSAITHRIQRPTPPSRSRGPAVAAGAAAALVLGLGVVWAVFGGEETAPPPVAIVDPDAPPAEPAEPRTDPLPDPLPVDAGTASAPDPRPDTPTGSPPSRTTAEVRFSSTPAGAQVWIRMDRRIRLLCTTPCSFDLPRGKEVLVELRLDGHVSAQRTLIVDDGARFDGALRRR